MRKQYFLIQVFSFVIISIKAFSFSTSSYLIANSAIINYDYEEAYNQYNSNQSYNLNNNDLARKLLSYVNASSFSQVSKIAAEILKHDKSNQEAWMIYLINAKMNKLKTPFDEFKKVSEVEKLSLIKLIFYEGYNTNINKKQIAESIFDLVKSSILYDDSKITNYDYIIFYLSLSLNLYEKFDEANFYLAQIYEQLKNYNKAEIYYNKLSSDHYYYLESMKNIALNKRFIDIKESEKDLISLNDKYQENLILLIALGDFYRITKQYEKSIVMYSKILNKKNLNKDQKWRILYMRGICYERKDNWKLAEDDLLQALDINPDSSQVLNYLAYAWIEKNMKLDLALKMLKKAYKQDPDSHYILDSLAWAYFKKNDLLKASRLMEEVVSRAPGEAISLDHLGDIYFAMGREREGYYMWKQARDLASPEDDIIDSVNIKINKYNAG